MISLELSFEAETAAERVSKRRAGSARSALGDGMTEQQVETMTKADLIDVVHRRTGLSKREATRSVETFIDLIQALIDVTA